MQNGLVLGLRAPVQAFGVEKELDALAHTGCPPTRVLSLQKLEKQRLLPATLLKQAADRNPAHRYEEGSLR